jgi:hypothetical protein
MLIEKFTRILFKSSKYNDLYDIYAKALLSIKDITNNSKLSIEERKQRLLEVRKAFYKPDLETNANIKNLREMFVNNRLDQSLYTDVLAAHEKYLAVNKLQVWEEFVVYHRLLASPVSRFALALHDESPSTYLPMETLYSILAMLTTISSIKEDFSSRTKCLIPQDIMDEYGIRCTDLALSYTSDNVYKAIKELIKRIDAIQMDVKVLPLLIKSFRLRVKINIIISLTNSMIKKHYKVNVLQNPPVINIVDYIVAFVYGIVRSFIRGKTVQGNII